MSTPAACPFQAGDRVVYDRGKRIVGTVTRAAWQRDVLDANGHIVVRGDWAVSVVPDDGHLQWQLPSRDLNHLPAVAPWRVA